MLVSYRPLACRNATSPPKTSAPAVARPVGTRRRRGQRCSLRSASKASTRNSGANASLEHPYKQSAVGSLAPEALVSSLQWARARTIRKRTNQPS